MSAPPDSTVRSGSRVRVRQTASSGQERPAGNNLADLRADTQNDPIRGHRKSDRLKTYPIRRSDGFLHAFEIGNAFISMGAIRRILSSVDGVSSIRRQPRSDDRLAFNVNGVPWVVHEPWGDNSRYWIGPRDPQHHSFDVNRIHEAFAQYRSPLFRLWVRIRNVGV